MAEGTPFLFYLGIWQAAGPLEIVSNSEGGEDAEKRRKYVWMRVPFYVIYDPQLQVMTEALTVYRLQGLQYERQGKAQFPELKLGLALWEGEFEGRVDTWLRWTDEQGMLIPTDKERAEQEHQRAEQEHQRVERLAALLRQAGIDPEQQ